MVLRISQSLGAQAPNVNKLSDGSRECAPLQFYVAMVWVYKHKICYMDA